MYWIIKGFLGGSGMPFSGDEIDHWRETGVRRVLVLPQEWELEEGWGDSKYYFSQLRERGLSYMWLPIPDGAPPTREQFEEAVKWIDSGRGNLVHCVGGRGRTGTVLAGYLIVRRGLNARRAVEVVRSKREGAVETLQQLQFLWSIEGEPWTT
ncbi:protein-tyrosine phosphatase family protein [Sulfodiicoccus acidiphilus]|uniref:protein-tyrosine phosphatase family protein n=1 Tax=Sulfodiicoccus acidiphilus TaxID=1670455 RepID=UPI000F81ECC0|nr:dual specificity protein phosphatase family protein [Sulfodiicoccus acidiphilus]